MSNHVFNELVIQDDRPFRLEAILAKVRGESEIDFEVLLPAPLNIWCGNVGPDHEAAFPGTHLDWARKNWGTKWNAYGLGPHYQPIERSSDTLTLRFQTAWSPPMGWIVALFNHFKISFDHNWLREGAARGRCGRFDYTTFSARGAGWGGTGWSEKDADDDMQRHLHLMLWGVESFDETAT